MCFEVAPGAARRLCPRLPLAKRRGPDFTVDHLVRAAIVRAWADACSDRALEWHLTSNLVVRWFVGLSLFAPRVPDHTTLARFHAWMRLHAPNAWFADGLAFLDRVDPADPVATT